MTSDGGPLLTVRGLTRAGIDIPDFDLAAGEAMAVLGPSGSGKSLFLRALADLDENEGDIQLGREARDAMGAPDWRRRVTYVAAESGWWAETVAPHYADWNAAAPLATRLGLTRETGDWQISRLSTGERQRLALVRALIQMPDVLLLDEPTSGLDGETEQAVEEILVERLAGGAAILFSTHDEDQASRLAKRCLRFAGGGKAEIVSCR
ncbi:MAG: ABC transporter ATP-binding protein [Alphaproteobacteria bacterium]|nr:ABC transporter ATP-binding protein [Alphaproteobacteria bacterium]